MHFIFYSFYTCCGRFYLVKVKGYLLLSPWQLACLIKRTIQSTPLIPSQFWLMFHSVLHVTALLDVLSE